MGTGRVISADVAVLALSSLVAACGEGPGAAPAGADALPLGGEGVPRYVYDAAWPRLPLPNQWILGEVGGIGVDRQGHIWVIQRPWTVSGRELAAVEGDAECCRPAPPVIEFDAEGNVVQAWPELRQFFAEPGTPAGQGFSIGGEGQTLWEATDVRALMSSVEAAE